MGMAKLSASYRRFMSTESLPSDLFTDTVRVSLNTWSNLQVVMTLLFNGQSIDEQAPSIAAKALAAMTHVIVLRISVSFLFGSRCGSVMNGSQGRQ